MKDRGCCFLQLGSFFVFENVKNKNQKDIASLINARTNDTFEHITGYFQLTVNSVKKLNP